MKDRGCAKNPTVSKRRYRAALAKKHGMCSYCGPHRGENASKPDRAKPKAKEHS